MWSLNTHLARKLIVFFLYNKNSQHDHNVSQNVFIIIILKLDNIYRFLHWLHEASEQPDYRKTVKNLIYWIPQNRTTKCKSHTITDKHKNNLFPESHYWSLGAQAEHVLRWILHVTPVLKRKNEEENVTARAKLSAESWQRVILTLI